MPTVKDDSGRAMARDVGAAGVDHMGQVQSGQHLLDQFAAELTLHETVGGDQAHEARAAAFSGRDG
ncbi:hypothetical protein D3C72_2132640 [compost metagenome]